MSQTIDIEEPIAQAPLPPFDYEKLRRTAEFERLEEHHHRKVNWKNWGPYLSERSWGTVREDYSEDGNAWSFFPHDHARSRVYRWNEEGLGGISDRNQYLCFSISLWNGHDPILKERMFGLTGPEGNHGEDPKDYWFYLDSTPTHSYMKMLYKYPQKEFPYKQLIEENSRRGFNEFEYELLDTRVFDQNRYFDVFIEYAKAAENDLLIKVTIHNRGPDAAPCTVLPTAWFRNTWSWGYTAGPQNDVWGKPSLHSLPKEAKFLSVEAKHPTMGDYYLYAEEASDLLFTENETNNERLFGTHNASPYVKDAFNRYVIEGEKSAVNPAQEGTKCAALYQLQIPAGQHRTLRLRLTSTPQQHPFESYDTIFEKRLQEADEYYNTLIENPTLTADERNIQRQAFAGLLWSKQLFYFDVNQWLNGDKSMPPPPKARFYIRNGDWRHMVNFDVITMPDKWEYPWYATWDTAFNCIALVLVDPDFAKRQMLLPTREWYMHPNGQLPAYEWNFSDVNPPTHAWGAWRIYQIDGKYHGSYDREFLEGIFHKLMINFTWWVNKKDKSGRNVFQGGFLGMDNISVFDRSKELPTGGYIDQSDGTAWMGFYCIMMMKIAIELAKDEPVYQDTASKFFEHFLRIAAAMVDNGMEGEKSLWCEEDGFFYDLLNLPDGQSIPLKVRSLVGILPLFSVETLDPELMKKMPIFNRRLDWFIQKNPSVRTSIACVYHPGAGSRRLLSILSVDKLKRILGYLLDENEFLSEYGIRSVSAYHRDHPYIFNVSGTEYSVRYVPAESDTGLFGGNSNWRGPIWFPLNYLIIESLQKYHYYYGDDLKVEFPTGSGNYKNLYEVATELSKRLIKIFEKDPQGHRPCYGGIEKFQTDPYWKDLVLFNEYFHGDNGAGLGATHQTGWTGLVAKLIQQSGGKR